MVMCCDCLQRAAGWSGAPNIACHRKLGSSQRDAAQQWQKATMKVRYDMATLDWSQCPAVESIPGKVSGAWVFKDTRMPVSIVFENLEAGATIDEIMEWFHLNREQIVTVLEFAARSLDPFPPPQAATTSTVNAHPA